MSARSLAARLARGFTLIEIMVAVLIFAIIASLAYGGYNELLKQSTQVEKAGERTHAIQMAITRMSRDFASLEPRPVRAPLGGGLEPALRADSASQEELVELTHSGWTNPAGVPRSTLQRVAYRLQDNKLSREYWVVLDRAASAEPVSAVLLDGVKSVQLRYMDMNRGWHDEWPAAGDSSPTANWGLPIAVEVTLELDDWGKLVRLVEVSG